MNVTFDNNVLLSATLWDGSIAQKLLFDILRRGDIKIYISEDILNEYKTVLNRDFDFSEIEISNIIKTISDIVRIIKTTLSLDIVKEDKDDNAVIVCAIESNSHFLITYDPHLLNIRYYKKIKIITPEAARATI